MSRSLFALLLPAVVALCACEPDDPCSVAATVTPNFELGVGETDFRALSDGDSVSESFGNQGGSHIWIAYRAQGVVTGQFGAFKAYEQGPDVMLTLTAADGELVGEGSWSRPIEGDETEAFATGIELYSYGRQSDADLSSLLLEATLVDTCGVELTDSVAIVVQGWL